MKKPATAIALVGTPAFAADMAVKAPPPALEPVFSWTGFYVGAALGGEWADTTRTGTSGSSLSTIRLLPTPSPRKSD